MKNKVKEAIALLGSQRALAEKCGSTQQAVSLWLKKGRFPADKLLKVEAATGLKREELRPELYEGYEAKTDKLVETATS